MPLTPIINYVVAQLLTLPGIGLVHDHVTFINDDRGFLDKFTILGVVNVVEVTRRATPAAARANGGETRLHDIVMHVYYGLQESSDSELAHRTLVEEIYTLFEGNHRLGGNAQKTTPVSVEISGEIDKAGKLLHYAACVLTVTEDIR